MNILYVTTPNPRAQGDYQENVILHGLRSLIGANVVDFPRKKVMYGDFSETTRDEMHGRGFTLYTNPINDLDFEQRKMNNVNVILYGVTNAYGVTDFPEINKICQNIWYVDGHDTPDIKKKPCFKRELFNVEENVYPTGFGIPHYQIRPISLVKDQLIQKTTPSESLFKVAPHGHLRVHYPYTWKQENEYYEDMQRSWFGLTCMKGGWDSLRHYEIMASGSLLLFKNYNKKPKFCSPQELPCHSYSSIDELNDLMQRLVQNNKPTKEYLDMLFAQRGWLLKYGTTESRALEVLKVLLEKTW